MPETICLSFHPAISTIHQNKKWRDTKIIVTFTSKNQFMKKIIVSLVLIAGIAAVAIASLNSTKKKVGTEKKMEKKERKCSHTCPLSYS
jgi:hypothetical protein